MALNPRQEKFAIAFALSGNCTKAALAAGYSKTNAHRTGSWLKKHPEVIARVKVELERFRDEQHAIMVRETSSAVQTLVDLMTGKKKGTMVQLGAANSILDRAGLPAIRREEKTGRDGAELSLPPVVEIRLVEPGQKQPPQVDAEPASGKVPLC